MIGRTAREAELLATAKQFLDPLEFYPRPVSLRAVRIVHWPWFFKLPVLRRFCGWAAWWLIIVADPLHAVPAGLIVHELTHIWQQQHHPLRMPVSYWFGYERNPYELQARAAQAQFDRLSR